MREQLIELWRFRYLLKQLVARELKTRYKNSALGFLWSIVPPLLQVVVYTFFMRGMVGLPVPNYSVYLLCGLIPWTFFSAALLDACQALLLNYGIMRKVYMPREVIPLAYVISNTIHFLLGWAVYFVIFYVVLPLRGVHIPIIFPAILWFPVILLMEVLLVTGLSLWLAAVNMFYQDVKYIVQTLLNLLLFVMPVILTADSVFLALRKHHLTYLFRIYMLNPVAAIITAFREVLLPRIALEALDPKDPTLKHVPPPSVGWPIYLAGAVMCVGIAWSGYAYFNARKWQFVERF